MEIRPILAALLRNKTGAILVAVQVAISMAILANALHIVNVRQAVAARPSGIADEHNVFFVNIDSIGKGGPEQHLAEQKRFIDVLSSISGVQGVAQVGQIPMTNNGSTNSVAVDRKQTNETANAAFYTTPGNLLKTWGLKLVAGRDFQPGDFKDIDSDTTKDFTDVVIVTKALADKMFPGQDAIGKTMFFGTGEEAIQSRIVGVVERLQTQNAQVGDRGEYSTIVPIRFTNLGWANFTVHAEPGQLDRVMKDAEQALRKASATPIITEFKTIDETRKERYRADMAMAWMLVTVSVLLLLITASGIVGMASLWVTQRRKQIGVRRALGARKVDILRYFITENFMITSMGVVAGVLGAVGLNQFLVAQLEMARLPLGYLVAGSFIFWLLGVFAVYGPAWRAASISPALATRTA
ncbi:MAG: ABC transporter permease [Telluria sp.]